MAGSRLVRSALCCYPRRWRTRHGEEAAELARLLIRDGTPARSIAWSYVKGAASTRLVLRSRERLGAAVGALVAAACAAVVSLALLSSSVPANAISVSRVHGTDRARPIASRCTRNAVTPAEVMRFHAVTTEPANSGHGQHC